MQPKLKIQSVDDIDQKLLYSLSHDLRQPVRGIMGYLKIMQERFSTDLDDECLQMLSQAQRLTLQLKNQLDGLLQLSRIKTGELNRETIDLAALIQNVVLPKLQKRFPEIPQIEIQPSLPSVFGDRKLVTLVLGELLSNSIVHGPRTGTAKIAVNYNLDENHFEVRDSGKGVPPCIQDKATLPFVSSSNDAELAGGMGLALVFESIQKHGGSFAIVNEENDGYSAIRFNFGPSLIDAK